MAVEIRPATLADLPAAWEIFYQDEIRGVPKPFRRTSPIALEHHLRTGFVCVAVDEDVHRVIGFSAGIVRPETIGYPAGSSRSQALASYCTHNFPGLSLYLQAGLRSLSQFVMVMGERDKMKFLPNPGVELLEVQADNRELQDWDARISGVSRPQDFEHWAAKENGRFFLLRRDSKVIGYGVGRIDSPAFFQRDSVRLGPIGASFPDVIDVNLAMIRWAFTQRPHLSWRVFISNPALPLLLKCGLRITYLASYLGTEPSSFDPACYSHSGYEF